MKNSHLSYNNQNSIAALKNELKNRKDNLGENHFLIAETLNSLALTHLHMMDDHQTAMQLHHEAMYILEQQEQTQQKLINLAITIGDIGNCYWKKGDYESARNEYMRSLQFFKSGRISHSHSKAKLCIYAMEYRLSIIPAPLDLNIKPQVSLSIDTSHEMPCNDNKARSQNNTKSVNNQSFPDLTRPKIPLAPLDHSTKPQPSLSTFTYEMPCEENKARPQNNTKSKNNQSSESDSY